jgi:hypothetical protein
MYVNFHLAAGTNFTSDPTDETFEAYSDAKWAGGHVQNGVITTASATWQITGVQLEVGDTATPFEHRSYGDELARCQRYYYKFTDGGVANTPLTNASVWDVNGVYAAWKHSMEMRASPTGASGGAFDILTGGQTQKFTDQLNVNSISRYGCEFNFQKTGHGLTVGRGAWVRIDAGGGGYVEFDAEL